MDTYGFPKQIVASMYINKLFILHHVQLDCTVANLHAHTSFTTTKLEGVYKRWNGLLEWWNTGMVEWNFLKFNIIFLHPNKYISSPYVSK